MTRKAFLTILFSLLVPFCLSRFHIQQAAAGSGEIKDITWRTASPLRYLVKGPVAGIIGDRLVVAGGTQIPTAVLEKYKGHFRRVDAGHGYYVVVDTNDPELAARIHAEMRVAADPWSRIGSGCWIPKRGAMEDFPNAPEHINWPWGMSAGEELYVLPHFLCRERGDKTLISREVWRLARKTGSWKWDQLPPFTYARVWPGLAVVGSTLIAAGGAVIFDHENPVVFTPKRQSVETSAVQGLDLTRPEKGWFELPPIPGGPRSLFATATVGGKVYVFGGYCRKGWINYSDIRGYYRDAYVFDLEPLRWRKLPDLPFATYGVDAAVYQDRYVVMAGGIKIGHSEPVAASADQWSGTDEGNFEVVIFDTKLESYRILPTRVPPFPFNDAAVDLIAGWKAKVPAHDWMMTYDFSKGIYRQSPKLRLIRNQFYLFGGDVVGTPKNATDELLVGTIQ